MAPKHQIAVAPGDADSRLGSASLSGHGKVENKLGPPPESWDYARKQTLHWEKALEKSGVSDLLEVDEKATAILHHVLSRRASSGSGGLSASAKNADVNSHPCSKIGRAHV